MSHIVKNGRNDSGDPKDFKMAIEQLGNGDYAEVSAIVTSFTVTMQGEFRLNTITSTWPSDDTFSIRPSEFQNVRSFRFKADKTVGSTAGAVLKYAIDADDEALAEQLLTSIPSDPSIQPYTYSDLEDGVWSEWVDLFDSPDLPSLLRADFLATADTWNVVMEVR